MRFLKYLIEFDRLEAGPIDGRDIVERDGVEMNGVVCSLAAMGDQFEMDRVVCSLGAMEKRWSWNEQCGLLFSSNGCSV